MHMGTTEIFLIAMLIIFSVPYLIWRLGNTDYYAPLVVVQIITGVLLAVSLSGKLIGTHIAGRILKWGPGEASIIGWLLQTKALIMIIFSNILLDKGVITNETFTALLLMAIGSTMLTVPVVYPKLQRVAQLIFKTS